MKQDYYTISELAKEFNISTRTIRYYEEVGLLRPERDQSKHRFYSKGDYTRLKLILRGKHFGFSLDEIKEMIELFYEDRTGKKQLAKTIKYGEEKIAELNKRIDELILLRDELIAYKKEFELKLAKEKENK